MNAANVRKHIPSGAEQKHRMLEADSGPTAYLSFDGYLIGQRLNLSRPILIKNTDAFLAKAKTDRFSGCKTDGERKPLAAALHTFRTAGDGRCRPHCDRRTDPAHQQLPPHAVDGLYPYTSEANVPARKFFKLPVDRPFNRQHGPHGLFSINPSAKYNPEPSSRR